MRAGIALLARAAPPPRPPRTVTGVHTPRTPAVGLMESTVSAGKGLGRAEGEGGRAPGPSGSKPVDSASAAVRTRTAGGGTLPGMSAVTRLSCQEVTCAVS